MTSPPDAKCGAPDPAGPNVPGPPPDAKRGAPDPAGPNVPGPPPDAQQTAPRADPGAARKRAWTWALVVLLPFVVYNANFRELGLTDTVPATLLPASLLHDGDLILDEFQPLLVATQVPGTTLAHQVQWTLAMQVAGGHLRSSYPVGPALLAVPFYVPGALFGGFVTFDDYRLAAKLAASSLVALSAGFLFLILRRWCENWQAALWALGYALGTAACTIASQALWQHGPALFCLAVALWAAVRLDETERRTDAALLSGALALAVICRPQCVLASAPLVLYALFRHRNRWLALTSPAVVLAAWQVSYNLRVFGNPAGGYGALYNSMAHSWRGLDAASALSEPLLQGLKNLLFSPGKGLIVYSPVLFIGMAALPALARARKLPLAWPVALWCFSTLLFYAKNLLWWGGTAYGPRYLTELSLPLTMTLAVATCVWPGRLLFGIALALTGYGVLIQLLGLLTWPCGWHVTPMWFDVLPERAWDWHDSEVGRCLRVLVEEGPKPPELGPFAR